MKLGSVICVGVMAASSACVSPSIEECGGGLVCPSGTTCTTLDATHSLCATSEQTAACVGIDAAAPCTLAGITASVCLGGACVATVCGDGRVDASEVCDDGNVVSGDGCSSDCRSDESCGNGTVDPSVTVQGQARVNELCDDGNLVSGDGCSSSCTVEAPQWVPLDHPITARSQHAMTYDSGRERIVLFGGATTDVSGGLVAINDTSEWDGVRWHVLAPATSPAARTRAAMAYDPVRHRTLLFGGDLHEGFNSVLSDTWQWNGTTWSLLSPEHQPTARAGATMVYDGARDRIVLFGGRGNGPQGEVTYDDTWAWDGKDWTELPVTTRPGAREQHVMAYDPKRGVVVVAGGEAYDAGTTTYAGDTWELEGDMWTLAGSAPDELHISATMAWDPVGQRLIAYGGNTVSGDPATPTMWTYGTNGWTSIAQVQPGVLFDARLVTDPAHGTTVLFGGYSNDVNADTWLWNGSTWSPATAPLPPPEREFAASASDPVRRLAWVFGGADSTNTSTNTLLSFDGSAWTVHAAAGTPPTPRVAAGVAYDRARQRLVVFGGAASLASPPADAVTYLWDGSTWTSTTTAAPSARVFPAMTYDPIGKRVVLFGGFDTGALADTWAWDGTAWHLLSTPVAPPPLVSATMFFNDARGTIVLQGGNNYVTGVTTNELWELSGTTWTLTAATTPPPARVFHAGAYDAAARRSVISGGILDERPFGDTWRWQDSWEFVSSLIAPAARGGHVMFTNPAGAGIIAFGGTTSLIAPGPVFADTWLLRSTSDAANESCATAVDYDGDGLAGCSDPDCWFVCAPTCAPQSSSCDVTGPHCGDGVCSAIENCRICPDDCSCTAVCGDDVCDATETAAACPGDCTP